MLSVFHGITPPIVWLLLTVAFAAFEASTVGLTSIWFAVGALAALMVSFFSHNFWLQAEVFVAVSLLTLLLLRPVIAKKFHPKETTPTNSDSLIGKKGIVTQSIDNLAGTGQVKIAGQTWTARSESGEPLPKGTTVTAVRIEGVRLFVRAA